MGGSRTGKDASAIKLEELTRSDPGHPSHSLAHIVLAAHKNMTVPFTGALVLIFGLWLFLFLPKLLYPAMVISIPFSAMAVINFGSGDTGRGLAAWLFLGFLWIVHETLSGVPPWHARGWFVTRRARYGLLAFLLAVFASVCVPLVLNGTAWVPDLDPGYLDVVAVPLQFGAYNLTRTAYVLFGVMLTIFAAAENVSSSRIFHTLRLYVGSCIFAAVWGLFQFWCNVTGHNYPAYVFNNSTSLSAYGYEQTLASVGLKLARVSSVALEPSVLGEELLIALIVLLVCRGLRSPLLSRKWDFVAIASIGAGLLVTTSTTAYVGILIVLLAAGVALFRAGKPWSPYFISAGAAVAAGALATALIPVLGQLASIVLVDKLGGGSGAGRLKSIVIAAHAFLRYPVLGTGWHRVYSSDLVFLILANTGVVGFAAFLSFMWPTVRYLWTCSQRGHHASVILLAATIVVLALAEGTMLEYAAGYDWLFFGLAAGAVGATSTQSFAVKRRALAVPSNADPHSPTGATGLA